MLKKMVFAMVPVMLLATVAMAEDDLLSDLDVNSIQDAEISIDEAAFDIDVDKLAENADGDEAIEACFRRFGYSGFGHRYWGGCYNYCYRPCFNVCYRTYYCYRPVVYHTCAPIYRLYWGCY